MSDRVTGMIALMTSNYVYSYRSFQYVSDLVTGMIALMNSNYSQPVNLGNPDEHSILTFAKLIR